MKVTGNESDSALLPPCAKSIQKNLRALYVSKIWGHADAPFPGLNIDPLKYGWMARNDCLVPEWYSGQSLTEHLHDETKEANLSTFESEVQNLEHDDSDAALIVPDEEDSS